MKPYKIEDLLSILEYNKEDSNLNHPYYEIQSLVFDSRNINQQPSKSLFFSFKTDTGNGNKFIAKLVSLGVLNFIIDNMDGIEQSILNSKELNIILVSDVLKSIQSIATFHRNHFDLETVIVTGSNGKTIVKDWLFDCLKTNFNICKSPLSYNSQIGVPISVWELNTDNNLAIFEAGISKPREMESLAKIIQPTIGIFTNIHDAHQVNFETLQQKVEEKSMAFTNCQKIIYRKDYSLIDEVLTKRFKLNQLYSWSTDSSISADLHFIFNNETIEVDGCLFKFKFSDYASQENIAHIICFLKLKGFDNSFIQKQISTLNQVDMRMKISTGYGNCTIINDAYSGDLFSLNKGIELLNQQVQHSKKVLVLSHFEEVNDSELRSIVQYYLDTHKLDLVLFVDEDTENSNNIIYFKGTSDLIKYLNSNPFYDTAILIKGSRRYHFESIANYLIEKHHRTRLEVNLTALRSNYKFFKSKLNPTTKIMAMVKAFSYGAGSYEVASVLQYENVDYLGVAYTDEGITLRKKGIQTPILVLNPEPDQLDELIEYQLYPEIYSFHLLESFLKVIKNKKLKDPYQIHLKIDTGMHRLGFEPKDINPLILRLLDSSQIKIEGIFSHLVGSESEVDDDFTIHQISNYKSTADKIESAIGYSTLKHILNSGGILRWKDSAQLDMVRLGIGLFGIDPTKSISNLEDLMEVNSLKSYISQIKHLENGDFVGYNRKGVITRPSVIATVEIGYADGIRRCLGNGNFFVKIKDELAPTIGNICMDMLMIDITDAIKHVNIEEGDEVIFFSQDYSISNFANSMKTIEYEALTSISERVKRVYIKE